MLACLCIDNGVIKAFKSSFKYVCLLLNGFGISHHLKLLSLSLVHGISILHHKFNYNSALSVSD